MKQKEKNNNLKQLYVDKALCLKKRSFLGLILIKVILRDTIKIHPRSKSTKSKSTQSSFRTAYQSRVRVRVINNSNK